MKQNDLLDFLNERYGKEKGTRVYRMQQRTLKELVNEITTTSKTQQKTLKDTILPRIALYLTLQRKMDKMKALDVVNDYLQSKVCEENIREYQKLEKLPCFFGLFKRIFTHIVLTSDNWTAKKVSSKPDAFQIDIHKCLWYDTCVEYGCPELTPLFCACDDTLYSALHKISFTRAGSIGRGNDICDFHFKKN
ncbi:MAG: L-2-amino-thiazoline-4-carboxylic acid hydrolase [bacterium]|nr:L-2-amino-thiazoline-4-carboxylic acid hydrolase [bacterium]